MDERQLEEVHLKTKLSDIGSIQTSTVYLELDETGVQTELSEEEFKNSDNGTPRQKSISDTTLVHDVTEKTKGNMKQQMIIVLLRIMMEQERLLTDMYSMECANG